MIESVQSFNGRPSGPGATAQERAVIVFHVMPSIEYARRWTGSMVLVMVGLLLQAVTLKFWTGVPLLLFGSLLLCVKGYHNWVEGQSFHPGSTWENCEPEKLDELMAFDRKILRWNRSFMDVTNGLGLFVFLLILAPAALFLLARFASHSPPGGGALWAAEILAYNAVVLLAPHWVTGVRRILRLPKLMIKVEVLKTLLDRATPELGEDKCTLMAQLEERSKLPMDVKLRVAVDGAREGFMGLYVQVVTNDVQGKSYPYLYAVLVARQGYGLHPFADRYTPPKKVIREYKEQDEVEIIVIRQHTTKQSGYHTNAKAASNIFLAALALARRVARSPRDPASAGTL